jgi:hypothetical protein
MPRHQSNALQGHWVKVRQYPLLLLVFYLTIDG